MLKRDISTTNIIIVAASSMIGSGWLFSPFLSVQIAGPNALIAWILCAVFIAIIALPLCELSAMLPVSGGLSTYPALTHGVEFGMLFAWTSWLTYISVTPIETQAVLQYASYFFPKLLDQQSPDLPLSLLGYGAAFVLIGLLTVLNTLGIKFISECNRFTGVLKFLIPCIAIISLFYVSNLHTNIERFTPHLTTKQAWQDVFSALSTGGVAFALMGFQNSFLLAGEVKKPGKVLVYATLRAIVLGFLFYFALQLSFISAIPEKYLSHGWQNLNFPDAQSPLVGLTILVGLGVVATLILIDSCLSPLGTALIYTTTTSRILYSMSLNHLLPAFFLKLNRHKIPYRTLLINFIASLLFFLPFPGWKSLMGFLSSVSLLGYSMGPLCVMAMRQLDPTRPRPWAIKPIRLVSYLAFSLGNLMLCWCGFTTIWKLCLAIALGVILHIFYKRSFIILKQAIIQWFAGYLLTMLSFSLLTQSQGIGLFVFPYDILVLFMLSIGLFAIAQKCITTPENYHKQLALIKRHNTEIA